jgi:glucan phosphorylase
MKFAMNGCLILAARGGSNDELRQEIGGDNIVEFLSNSLHLSCKTIFLS